MDSFYQTSINFTKKPNITEISPCSLFSNINIPSFSLTLPNSSSDKTLFFRNKKEKNEFSFPYHLFSKFPSSFERYLSSKKINIPKKINYYKKLLKNNDELLQKISSNEIYDYLRKLNYGPDFFIQFAKKKKELIKNKNIKVKEPLTTTLKKSFAYKLNTNNYRSKKRVDFYELILKEVNDEYDKVKKNSKNKNQNGKIIRRKSVTKFTFDNNINEVIYNSQKNLNNLSDNNNKSNLKKMNLKLSHKNIKNSLKVIGLKKPMRLYKNNACFNFPNIKNSCYTNRDKKADFFIKSINKEKTSNDNNRFLKAIKNYGYNSNKNIYNSKKRFTNFTSSEKNNFFLS